MMTAAFDQRKAAGYFIVGWVKDWSLRMYLNTVAPGMKWSEARVVYPWLPDEKWFMLKGRRVRRWIAGAYPTLNNKLWDAPDNAARLRLVDEVLRLEPSTWIPRKEEARDAIDLHRSRSLYARKSQEAAARKDEWMRLNRHWTTVK